MSPIEWLCVKAPGFVELTSEERDAVMHFSLLWSFFEAEVLKTRASAGSIVDVVQQWEQRDQLDATVFAESLTYFQARYFQDDVFTCYFSGLNLRKNDQSELVKDVLSGGNNDPNNRVAALLIIVYRLRNNLFHGVKWAYGIKGQLNNFTHANAILMSALQLHAHL